MKSILKELLDNKNNEYSQYCLKELNGKEIELLEILKTLQQDKLYSSAIHGIYHSEKVLLFAFILSIKENLNEDDKKILLDAAMYHDIGREGDANDSFHGRSGALLIERVIDKNKYDDNDLKILKAIIDAHSRRDREMKESFLDYDLEMSASNYKRYMKLAKILKDVDALDRCRFGEYCDSKLDPNFLRTKSSKELIEYADKMNEIYRQLCRRKYQKNLKKGGFCYHSIGFDFFKLDSILEFGILSADEMKKRKIKVCKNFDGGNQYYWISVVDISKIEEAINQKSHSGYKEFVKHGISLICYANELMEPLSSKKKDEALLLGLPFDKGNYLDERYVYSGIAPLNIYKLEIPKIYFNKQLHQLNYIYNRLSTVQLRAKINYFQEIFSKNQVHMPEKTIEQYLAEYDIILLSSTNKNILLDSLLDIIRKINALIQDGMQQYFNRELGKNYDVTVQEVIDYILLSKGLDINLIYQEVGTKVSYQIRDYHIKRNQTNGKRLCPPKIRTYQIK